MHQMTAFRTLLMTLALSTSVAVAWAQSKPDVIEGQAVFGADGVLLGVVEQVVRRPDGHPAQLLVRPKGKKSGSPHSLAFAGVESKPEGFITPLTRAEFDAMPAVEIVSDEQQ